MTSAKKFLLILLSLSLVLLIASCGGGTKCDSCADEDGDGVCDVCGQEVPHEEPAEYISLIKNGVPSFRIVLANSLDAEVEQAVDLYIKEMLKTDYGIDVSVIKEDDSADGDAEIEILIGNVTSRGEDYVIDMLPLGKNGYAVKAINSKIVINAGSAEMLINTVEDFAANVLTPDGQKNAAMDVSKSTVHAQNDYKVTALKVNGTDMKGYTLAVDLTREYYIEAALSVQDMIYTRTGYWFDIVDIENATDKSFIFKNVPKIEGEESFKISANGSQLVAECAYDNMLMKAANRFIADKIIVSKGEVDFKGTVYTQDISVVYYEDFGAAGDGVTDDFKALYDTHVFANECGQTVKGTSGARYYLCETRQIINGNTTVTSIPICTNTDWQGARIIIDDRKIASFSTGPDYELSTKHVFSVLPDSEHAGVTFKDKTKLAQLASDGINPNTTHIDFKLDGWNGSLMIVPSNSQHKVFRRKGYSQHSGEAMHELIIIDKDGNVSEETPIMFDYTKIDSMTVYKLDPTTAISVGNGTIETMDTEVNHKILNSSGTYEKLGGYRQRGISVSRSYTTVHDIIHIVTGGFSLTDRADNKEGASVNGMFTASNADHVTFKDCIIPGRTAYGNASSYNFRATCVNKIVLDHCIQSNFWVTVDTATGEQTPSRDYVEGSLPGMSSVSIKNSAGQAVSLKLQWGIGGTNYCKNMEYIDSQISRFDAHAGLYDGKIIRTKINGMELTGVGDLIIEDVTWYPYATTTPFLYLRSDYGYHWDGDITAKNTRAYLYDITSTAPTLYIAHHSYSNWYFGYTAAFPNITLDNFEIYSLKNQAPMPAGYTAHLFKFKESASKMHLTGDTGVESVFDYRDADKNGFIDEPHYDVNLDGKIDELDKIDIDGDGKVGNTNIKMSSLAGKTETELRSGVTNGCTKNLNITRPPAYFKVINNTGGYKYQIVNTAKKGVSDGGWYRDASANDTYGGFFAHTKFIYGDESKGEYFIGTYHSKQTDTKPFVFDDSFY